MRVAPERAEVRRSPGPVPEHKVTALLKLIGEVRDRELVELRDDFNRPSRGEWGILFDPSACVWAGVRGKQVTVYARTAGELRDRLVARVWVPVPVAA